MLAINAWDESKSVVSKFAKEHKLHQTVLLDGGDVAGQYNVRLYPTTYWIGGDGIIVDSDEGAPGAATLERKTQKLLNGQQLLENGS